MEVALGIAALGVALAIRFFNCKFITVSQTDLSTHILYIRLIRDSDHSIPLRSNQLLGPGRLSYPMTLHYLLSFAPQRLMRYILPRFGVLTDGLTAVALAIAITYLSPTADSTLIPILCAAYLVIPDLNLPNIGPRSCELSPRSFAQGLYALTTLSAAIFMSTSNSLWILAVVLSVALTISASRFGHQVILLSTAVLSVSLVSFAPIGIYVVSLAISIAAGRGRALVAIRGHLAHITWYWRVGYKILFKRPSMREFSEAIQAGGTRSLAVVLFARNPLTSGALRSLVFMTTFVFFTTAMLQVPIGLDLLVTFDTTSEVNLVLFYLMCSGILGWLVTSFGRFRIFGESERYLEFAVPAAWILLFLNLNAGAIFPVSAGIVILGSCVLLLAAYATKRFVDTPEEDDWNTLIQFVQRSPQPRVLCLYMPDNVGLASQTDAEVFWPQGQWPDPETRQWYESFWKAYPLFPIDQLNTALPRYAIQVVVARTRDLAKLSFAGHLPTQEGWEKSAVGKTYVVFTRSVDSP